jgi:hypothetical protein
MHPSAPVFIHSFPRVASTWLGAKFMEQVGDAYFYEPLHSLMLDGTPEKAEAEFARMKNGKTLRHPPREKNYWHNYPFTQEGGIPGFQERFFYENYVLDPAQDDPDFKAYWTSLIAHAAGKGPVPCFKNTESALRQSWMKAHLGGTHIYIVQHPRLIDKSNFSFNGYQSPYLRWLAMAVAKNAAHPAIAGLADWTGIAPPPEGQSYEQEMAYYGRLFGVSPHKPVPSFSRRQHYNMLCFLWMMGLAQASRHADIIIDMEALREDENRHAIEKMIHEKTGLEIDLSGYKPKKPYTKLTDDHFTLTPEMIGLIGAALPHHQPDWERLKHFHLSPVTARAAEFFAHAPGQARAPEGQNLFAAMPQL